MSRSEILSFLLLTSLSLMSAPTVLAADPTLHQVYQAADAGNLSQAQSMLDKVLRDHPNSAKAHFVEAEILAKQGRRSDAASELNTAQRLAPGLPFANAQAVQSLKARLAPAALTDLGPPASTALGGNALRTLPASWGMLMLGFGVFALVLFATRQLGRRNPATPTGTSSGYGFAPAPYGAGGPSPTASSAGGLGSGILGGLASGAALGAGIVAGEALMHRLTDSNHGGMRVEPVLTEMPNDTFDDMGGTDFGIADNASWDDSAGGGTDDWS